MYLRVPTFHQYRMPKMHAIPQLVSASLNPMPITEHFRKAQCSKEIERDSKCPKLMKSMVN